ncbi:NUDIX domain-containing protein [Litorihabitans aurantiacus]|uniref:NTP pyrophosphohydrolase n=1 Tax=Litorihabitans aurantiacus TaxID=1930061 RepID=A0AA37UM35_9MICO|nr:NUDIX domain-containing protein [Litorihabitans aurantiacus]GMA30589.1 NTP pyrophosphohydrolase [Litorihabitans aurantiacus]
MRNAFDAWVECSCGARHWGLGGAAGLALVDVASRAVALQLRSERSHHGGTWGLPGGAIGTGETPLAGALREAAEEADVRPADVRPVLTRVLDHGEWSYTTVLARTLRSATGGGRPTLTALDGESADLRWVDLDAVADLPLHPSFAAAWPRLRALALLDPVLVVDVANVLGARPDGWWRDRAGASARLLTALAGALGTPGGTGAVTPADDGGVPAGWFGLDALDPEVARAWPRTVAVLEGAARDAAPPEQPPSPSSVPAPALELVRAPGSGDDAVVEAAEAASATGATVVVATADRGLRARLPAGVAVVGPGTLRDLVDRR